MKTPPSDWLVLNCPPVAGFEVPGDTNDRKSKLINGELVEVAEIHGGEIRLADGRTLPKGYRRFCHGYAVTSHASQGKTVDDVFLVASSHSFGAVNREQFYVSISRGRERCHVFTDDAELLQRCNGASPIPANARRRSNCWNCARHCSGKDSPPGMTRARSPCASTKRLRKK